MMDIACSHLNQSLIYFSTLQSLEFLEMCNNQSCHEPHANLNPMDESAFFPGADPTITERCLIAPSPELAEKIKKQLKTLRSSAGGTGFMLRMAEQKHVV